MVTDTIIPYTPAADVFPDSVALYFKSMNRETIRDMATNMKIIVTQLASRQ